MDDDNLSSYFQRSAAIVRQYADLIEQNYAQPALHYLSSRFTERPITMTFVCIFASLSVFPLLSFIGLTVFTLSSLVVMALVSVAITFITIEVVLVACLAFVLWSLLIVAGFATVVVVCVYWVTRLGMFVSLEGTSGVTDWAQETGRHIFYARKREATEDSDESAVLVDNGSSTSKKVKVEEEGRSSD